MSDFISWCSANQSTPRSMSAHVSFGSRSYFGNRTNCIEKRNQKSLHKTSKDLSSRFTGKNSNLILTNWDFLTDLGLQTGCETKFRQLQTAADVLQKLDKIPNTKTNRNDQEIDPDEIVNKFYQKRGFHSKGRFMKISYGY